MSFHTVPSRSSIWIRPNAQKQPHTPTYGHLQCVTHRPRRVVFGNSRDVLQWGLYFRLVSAALNYKGHKKSGRFAALSYSEIIVNCTFRSSAHFLDQSCNLFVYMLLHPQTRLSPFVLFVFPPLEKDGRGGGGRSEWKEAVRKGLRSGAWQAVRCRNPV